ncbi:carboxylesterase family protein [Lachnospiraceae bacterium 54-53]
MLVFIHGGNNQTGNAGEIPGTDLVKKDNCVYVSVDYRLGLLGFNCLPALQKEENSTGNYAMLDIGAALDWVKENIAAFGGDPGNVTISGFSAGGRDVMAMPASPVFKGKFQKAIAFSGGMTTADEGLSAKKIAAAMAPLAVEGEIREKMVKHVLNGRWFSLAQDEYFGNESLWDDAE